MPGRRLTRAEAARIRFVPTGPATLIHGPIDEGKWFSADYEAREAYRSGIIAHVLDLFEQFEADRWEIRSQDQAVLASGNENTMEISP